MDHNEEEKDADPGQEATPKKSNRGSSAENTPKIWPTSKEGSHVQDSTPGRRSPRRKKTTSGCHDNVDGSVDESVDPERRASQDCHPYAPSFGLRMRFSLILPTSGAAFKYITDDGKVRNRKIVSEKQPE